MQDTEQKTADREFVSYWMGKGYEKGQPQPFWIGLLRKALLYLCAGFAAIEGFAGIPVSAWIC